MATFLKTTESYRQGARTLPGRYYTAPEVLAEEHERIFRRRWICVGRGESIATSGDYILAEIAGESIIVLRDQAGERHAFYNVCRHRGTRLCEAPSGRLSETIQCPYHAWTYALDGRLIGAPHMHEVEGFARGMGGVPLRESGPVGGAARARVRAVGRPVRTLQSPRAPQRATHRVRGAGQLEAHSPEL